MFPHVSKYKHKLENILQIQETECWILLLLLLKAEIVKQVIHIPELWKTWLLYNLNALIVNSTNQLFPK